MDGRSSMAKKRKCDARYTATQLNRDDEVNKMNEELDMHRKREENCVQLHQKNIDSAEQRNRDKDIELGRLNDVAHDLQKSVIDKEHIIFRMRQTELTLRKDLVKKDQALVAKNQALLTKD